MSIKPPFLESCIYSFMDGHPCVVFLTTGCPWQLWGSGCQEGFPVPSTSELLGSGATDCSWARPLLVGIRRATPTIVGCLAASSAFALPMLVVSHSWNCHNQQCLQTLPEALGEGATPHSPLRTNTVGAGGCSGVVYLFQNYS